VDFARLNAFVGYGSLQASIWFLGMEEGVNRRFDFEESVRARIRTFRSPTIGLATGQRLLGLPLGAPRRLSQVWLFMAKIALALNGDPEWHEPERVHRYVLDELGAPAGNTLLTELLPLPRKRDQQWPSMYSRWFPDSSTYENQTKPGRIQRLRCLMEAHRPRVVFAYGSRHWTAYEDAFTNTGGWQEFAGPRAKMRAGKLQASGGVAVLLPFLGNGQFSTGDVLAVRARVGRCGR